MSRDPRRLFEEGTSEERELLSSARDDGPSPDSERRARIALGLAAPLLPVPGAEASAGSTAAGSAAEGSAAGSGVTGSAAAGSVATGSAAAGSVAGVAGAIKLGSLVLAMAGAATASWLALRDPAPAQQIEPRRTHAPDPIPAEPALPPTVSEALPVPPSIAPAGDRPRAPARARAKPPEPTLQQELELLRTARSHLAAGEPGEAEAALAQYRREIPNGALKEEADALAIETAFSLDRPEARARAAAFLSEFPDSPHAARAREIVADP